MLEERFKKIQDEFFRLQGQLAAGRLTKPQFTTALQDLMVEHEGRYWTIGGNSGKWYVHDGQKWVESEPPPAPEIRDEPPTAPPARPVAATSSPIQLQEIRCLEGHPDRIECIALSPDDRSVLSGGMDGTVKLWRIEGNKPPRTLVEGASVFKHVFGASFSAGGTYVVAASKDGFVRVWDVQTGRMVRRFTGCGKGAFAAVITPDERFVLAGCGDGSIRHWDMQTSSLVRILQGHTGEIGALALSPDGNRLGSIADDQTFRLWNIADGVELAQIALGTEYADKLARDLAFRPQSNQVLTCGMSMAVDLWDLETLQKVRRFDCGWGVMYGVAFSPDGKYLFTATGTDYLEEKDRTTAGGADNVIRIMEVETGYELGRYEGHNNDVTCLAVSRTGKVLVSGSEDKTIRVWRVE